MVETTPEVAHDVGLLAVPHADSRTGAVQVELRDVCKSFGAVQALRDVNVSVHRGEVVALLGPNGAGKTTAISIMLGLRAPTTGRARLLDLDPRDLRARSGCGVMLQESGVPMTLTVRELIDVFRSYYPAPLPAKQAIAMAGLDEKADARAGTLSGGQRQRLYCALAVCGDPAILFLDEPTTSLDVEARREFWAQMRDFVRAGKTVLLSTHYLEEADALADRVVVIDRGRVIADATPAALKGRVAGRRVSFDLDRPPDAALLAGLPVRDVALTHRGVTFLSVEPEAVLRALFARGTPLHNLEVVGAGLEEAFISLTHGQGA